MGEERNSLLERFASFSIREYALKKRGSWEEGCRWPLGHEMMPCPGYRWWASELETARSDPPAEGAFSGGRVKKPPKKKRSIVELFAVAPQVGAAEDKSEDEGEEDVDNMGELEKKKTKNKKKSKKEKLHDAVALSKSDVVQSFHGSTVGKCGKEIKDSSDKKTSVQTKVSSKQRKVRAIQSSNLVFKKKIRKSVVLPARGILKISNKTSPNKVKNSDNYHPSNTPNHVHSKQTKRHVSFSDQNDFIGQKKGSSVKLSDVLVVSAAAEKSGMVNETKNNGMTASADDIRQCSPEIREFSREDQTSPTALAMIPTEPLTKHKSVTTADHLVDLNHSPYGGTSSPFLEQGGPIPFASDVGAGCSSILGNITKTKDSNASIMGYLLDERAQMRSCPSRMKCSDDYPSMMNSSWSTSTPGRVSSELCTPRMRADYGQVNQSVNHGKDGFSIVSQVEPSRHQLMGRVCCSMPGIQLCPNGLEVKNPTLAFQGRCNNGNFIGLPLNSQGEFIQWHDKDNQLSENPNQFIVSERNCMQNSIEYWNNIDRLTNKGKFSETFAHLKEKPGQLPDPRVLHVNIGRYQEPVTTHDNQLSYLDQGSSGIYCNPCRKTNGIDSQHAVRFIQFEGHLQNGFQPINRPTVRLMGKDVAIGENSGNFQRFTGKEWVDKEIIVHRRHDEAAPNWFSQPNLIDDQSCGFVKNDILCSVDSGRTYPSIYDMVSVDHRQKYDNINVGPQWTARNAISNDKGHASNLVSFADHPTAMLVRNAPTIEPSKLMDTSVRYNSSMQIPSSHTQYQRDRILFPDERGYRRKIADRDGEYQERVNLADDVSQTMQPWSNNVRSQRNFQDASPYPSLHSKYRLFGMPETDVYRFADPSHSMEFANNSTAYGFSPIIAAVDSPLSSPFMKWQSNTAMNYDQQQIWRADIGIRPGFSYLRDLNQATRPKRRFPSEVDEFMRAPKRPHSVMLSQPGPQDAIQDSLYMNHLAQGSSPIDFHGYGNKVVGIHDTAKNSPLNTPGSDSQKPEDGSRSVPTKLSAGARHILRPGRNVDPGNSIPMHSTEPFVVGSTSGRIHEPQSKSAKIYQF